MILQESKMICEKILNFYAKIIEYTSIFCVKYQKLYINYATTPICLYFCRYNYLCFAQNHLLFLFILNFSLHLNQYLVILSYHKHTIQILMSTSKLNRLDFSLHRHLIFKLFELTWWFPICAY